jgi:hypothetical protein
MANLATTTYRADVYRATFQEVMMGKVVRRSLSRALGGW